MSQNSRPKCIVFIATSLDGFIARKDGGLDWLPQPSGEDDEEDYGYYALFESVDALVMGRNTYDMVQSFGEWPYGDKRVIVLTNRKIDNPPASVEQVCLSPRELVDALAKQGVKRLYIDGGNTIQQFLSAGLIDELIISTIPVLLGGGIPLFGPLENDIQLEHLETQSYPSHIVKSHYCVHSAAAHG